MTDAPLDRHLEAMIRPAMPRLPVSMPAPARAAIIHDPLSPAKLSRADVEASLSSLHAEFLRRRQRPMRASVLAAYRRLLDDHYKRLAGAARGP